MSKILITGASGFLGTKLHDMFSAKAENEVFGTYKTRFRKGLIHLDIDNPTDTHALLKYIRPDIVIHTASLTDINMCQENKEIAEMTNYIGTKNIVEACQSIKARLDYISSAYVFDGEKGNYAEDDIPNPVNWYSETKLMAEREVAKLQKFGIYRFDKLYGYNGEGRPSDAFSILEKGGMLNANCDQIRQPVLIDDVGHALGVVHEKSSNGIFHLAGPDKMTMHELSVGLAHLVGKENYVNKVPSREQLVRRPKNLTLSTLKAKSLGIKFTTFEEALLNIEGSMNRGRMIEGSPQNREREYSHR
jgi:dTDP-4-dehydrorhamnose reductase